MLFRSNLQQFAILLQDNPAVKIPRTYPELSTARVLTMELLEGIKLSDSSRLLAEGHDPAELARRDRRPVFAFFPFITSHAPFSLIAPYQPDWPRLLGDAPYDKAAVDAAFANEPDWIDLGPNYVQSLAYDFSAIADYLRATRDRDFVMIVLGDHQPL